MKRICVLLCSPVQHDSRTQRLSNSLAKLAQVDIFYVSNDQAEKNIPIVLADHCKLYPVKSTDHFLKQVYRHSYYAKEFLFLADAVIQSGNRYDLIYAHNLIAAECAIKVASHFKAKLVYDVHDLMVETTNQLFPSNSSSLKNVVFKIFISLIKMTGRNAEKKLMKRADLVVTTTEFYKNYLDKNYAHSADILVAPNYPLLQPLKYSDELYRIAKLSKDKNLILYQGLFGEGRFLERIVKGASYFDPENILILIGHGPLESKLKDIVFQNKLAENVKFIQYQPYDKLFELSSAASIGLMLIEHINLSKKYALANKVTEYMTAGIPVLASNSPENVRLLQNCNAGFIQDFSSAEEFGNYINSILKDKSALKQMGINGRKCFENKFNWDLEEGKFLSKIEMLMKMN